MGDDRIERSCEAKPAALTQKHVDTIRGLVLELTFQRNVLYPAITRLRFRDALACKTVNVTSMAIDPHGTLYISAPFVEKASRDDLMFSIMHCLLYPLLWHQQRRGSRDVPRYNRASARAINAMLRKMEVKDPSWGIILPKPGQTDCSVEQLYNDEPPVEQGGGGGGGGSAVEPDELGRGGGFIEAPNDDPTFRDSWVLAAHQVRAHASMGNGAGNKAGSDALLSFLTPPAARVPWRRILTQAVDRTETMAGRDDVSWGRLNRRAWSRGFFVPGDVGSRRRLAVVVDTSGSVSDPALRQVIGEVIGLADAAAAAIYLVVHDAVVVWEGWVDKATPTTIGSRMTGRGGTLFEPAYAAVEMEARKGSFHGMVHFTDGYCYEMWPAKPKGVGGDCVCALVETGGKEHVPRWLRAVMVDIDL